MNRRFITISLKEPITFGNEIPMRLFRTGPPMGDRKPCTMEYEAGFMWITYGGEEIGVPSTNIAGVTREPEAPGEKPKALKATSA